jgi:hypothetical protein
MSESYESLGSLVPACSFSARNSVYYGDGSVTDGAALLATDRGQTSTRSGHPGWGVCMGSVNAPPPPHTHLN